MSSPLRQSELCQEASITFLALLAREQLISRASLFMPRVAPRRNLRAAYAYRRHIRRASRAFGPAVHWAVRRFTSRRAALRRGRALRYRARALTGW